MPSKKYIVGNWKMNGLTGDLHELTKIDNFAKDMSQADVAVALPFTLLEKAACHADTIRIGSQNVHHAASGAHTGEISAAMLRECGAAFAIIGHSERRIDCYEKCSDVAAKAEALRVAGMGAILCIGEPLENRSAGNAVEFVTRQLLDSLPDQIAANWLTVAYEPIWAIGTGRVPSLDNIADMHAALRDALTRKIGEEAIHIRILYGGSVIADNACEILSLENVDGALVGGASLTAAKFIPIIRSVIAS